MKYSAALFVSALAALAKAVELTNTDFTVKAGEPFTITWTGASGSVDIILKNGESGDLKDVETITTGATGTSFVWTPDSDLPSDTYAFEIKDASGEVNYSQQFTFVGTGTATPTASTASSTTGSTTGSTTKKTTSTSTESGSTTNTTSASLTSSTMHVSNSTTLTTSASGTTSRISTTASSTGSSATSSSTGVPNTNNGQRLASSLALVLGAIAAFVAFN